VLSQLGEQGVVHGDTCVLNVSDAPSSFVLPFDMDDELDTTLDAMEEGQDWKVGADGEVREREGEQVRW